MTRYTELRHAGFYTDGLSDADRQKIADEVDHGGTRTEAPNGSTLLKEPTAKKEPAKK